MDCGPSVCPLAIIALTCFASAIRRSKFVLQDLACVGALIEAELRLDGTPRETADNNLLPYET